MTLVSIPQPLKYEPQPDKGNPLSVLEARSLDFQERIGLGDSRRKIMKKHATTTVGQKKLNLSNAIFVDKTVTISVDCGSHTLRK